MNRSQMLSILNTMSDDSLMRAMSATGIDAGAGDGGGMGGGDGRDEDDQIVSWNNTDVKVPNSARPKIFDKGQFEEAQHQAMKPQRGQVPYLQPEGMGPDVGQFGAVV